MGIAITELLVKKEIAIESLAGKTIAIDAPMWLYQFLSSIRGRDGSLLSDAKGNITSHLVGLSSRIPKLMELGIKLIFCFDGEPPPLKREVQERRAAVKIEAEKRYREAAKKEDIEGMKKYAARTARLTDEMIEDAKELINAFGIPIIEAPSEAEAQASHLVKKGDAYAVGTNDADCLMFEAPRLIRNLSIAGRKKKANLLAYDVVKPDLIELAENLNNLGIDQEQLIALAMLVGTDYNADGIKGIGPRNALKLVKQHKKDFDKLFKEAHWDDFFPYPWKDVFYLIKNIKVSEDYKLKWKPIDGEKAREMLVKEHNFSEERVTKMLERLSKETLERKQKVLNDFLR